MRDVPLVGCRKRKERTSVTNQTRERSLLVACPPSSSLKVGLPQIARLMVSARRHKLAEQAQKVTKKEQRAIYVHVDRPALEAPSRA